jgi:hypothetical protein
VDVASGGDCHKCHAFCSLRIDAEIEKDEEEAYEEEEEKERCRILVTSLTKFLPHHFRGFCLLVEGEWTSCSKTRRRQCMCDSSELFEEKKGNIGRKPGFRAFRV